jgi:four helix bundle protein
LNHKDLEVWKDGMALAREVYLFTRAFPKEELYGLTGHIRKTVVSIPSNIAEGAARSSDKEFIQFLYIALGSISELETQIILSIDFGYLKEKSALQTLESVRKKLIGLIKYLKNKKT